MQKKIISLLLILVMLLTMMTGTAFATGSNTTIYVNGGSGNDTTGNGSQSRPFKSIDKAVETAAGLTACSICVTEDTTLSSDIAIPHGTTVTLYSTEESEQYQTVTMAAGKTIKVFGTLVLRDIRIVGNATDEKNYLLQAREFPEYSEGGNYAGQYAGTIKIGAGTHIEDESDNKSCLQVRNAASAYVSGGEIAGNVNIKNGVPTVGKLYLSGNPKIEKISGASNIYVDGSLNGETGRIGLDALKEPANTGPYTDSREYVKDVPDENGAYSYLREADIDRFTRLGAGEGDALVFAAGEPNKLLYGSKIANTFLRGDQEYPLRISNAVEQKWNDEKTTSTAILVPQACVGCEDGKVKVEYTAGLASAIFSLAKQNNDQTYTTLPVTGTYTGDIAGGDIFAVQSYDGDIGETVEISYIVEGINKDISFTADGLDSADYTDGKIPYHYYDSISYESTVQRRVFVLDVYKGTTVSAIKPIFTLTDNLSGYHLESKRWVNGGGYAYSDCPSGSVLDLSECDSIGDALRLEIVDAADNKVDGLTYQCYINLIEKSAENSFTSYGVTGDKNSTEITDEQVSIDNTNHTITITIPIHEGLDLSACTVSYAISDKASVSLNAVEQNKTGGTIDLTKTDNVYTVKAENGSTQDYTVVVKRTDKITYYDDNNEIISDLADSYNEYLQYVIGEEKVIPQAAPYTKSGYNFSGWYSDAASGSAITAIPATASGIQKLYARWTVQSSPSSGGHSGGGGGGSAATVVTAPTTSTDTVSSAVEKGTTPQITAGTDGTASIAASDVKALADAKKPVEVSNGSNEAEIPAEVFTKNADAAVTVNIAKVDAATVTKAQAELAKDEKATQVGGADNTVSLEIKADSKAVSTFTNPAKVSTKVSADTLKGVKDVNHLTLAKVNDDGTLTYIGGKLDVATGEFTANTETTGDFVLVEKEDIKKITLGIGQTAIDVNGAATASDVAPVIVQNRTMMPLRFIAETLGADVKWDQKTKTVSVTVNGQTIELPIGQEIPGYGVGPILQNNRTLVPIRYISEKLGANVLWVPSTKSVEIVK